MRPPARDTVALRGLDLCARLVARAVDVVACVGGEGARLLVGAIAALDAPPEVLAERGADAAWAGLGAAAAGQRVALVLSGGDAAHAAASALREMRRLGVAALVVIPSHGEEGGRAVPSPAHDDLARLFDEPLGVLVAGCARELPAVTAAACARAATTRLAWAVAFALADVGLAVEAVRPPDDARVASWWGAAGDAGFEPVVGAARDGEARVVVGLRANVPGDVVLRQLRPFPFEALARRCGGASVVRVEEALPGFYEGRVEALVARALSATGARVEAAKRAAPEGLVRIDVALNEPARGGLVRALVSLLDEGDGEARAETHEPWWSTVWWRPKAGGAWSAVLFEAGALGLDAALASAPDGALALLVGPCAPEVVGALRASLGARAVALHHAPDASLAGV